MSFRAAILAAALASTAAHAADPQVERGRYLAEIASCNHCHTPGHFLGHDDTSRTLGGSDVGFGLPGAGVVVGPNLTPDGETGLGRWTNEQVVASIVNGVRPDGRVLLPVMPWPDYARLSEADALAIVAYLRSLPPIVNKVPGPFGPSETPSVFVMSVLPGSVYAGLPKPK